jgi:streptogramin lyase
MAFRKNQRSLTTAEKERFTKALLDLKKVKPGDTLSTYDLFVKDHVDAMNGEYAHMGPAFLAWHREYLRKFELELQRVSPPEPSTGGDELGLPYWDWSIDQAPPSWPFTADFLGGDGSKTDPGAPGKVTDGKFHGNQWTLRVVPPYDARHPLDSVDYLRREIGADPDSSLPSMEDVRTTLAEPIFDSDPWDEMSLSGFRAKLEGFRWEMQKIPAERLPSQMHNRIHNYIGGTMGPPTSPNDPIFWLHHCYVDKLWADWQRLHPTEPGYLPDGGAKKTGHNLSDVMKPWVNPPRAPKDVVNIRDLGYHYVTEFAVPTASSRPRSIALGPDGNLWFTEFAVGKIGRITPYGEIKEFVTGGTPFGICSGPDGNLWFTDNNANKIGRITTSGAITTFDIRTAGSNPYGITTGPDGALWFTEAGASKIGRLSFSGESQGGGAPTWRTQIDEYPLKPNSHPYGITSGPDGNIWFTEGSANKIGRITPSGVIEDPYHVPTANSQPYGICIGPDRNLWFTENNANKIGRISPSTGKIEEFQVRGRPSGICLGQDGNLWFTEEGYKIGRITPSGVITEFDGNYGGAPSPLSIISGPNWPVNGLNGTAGSLWFTEFATDKIGQITL